MKTRFYKAIREPSRLTRGVHKPKVRVKLSKEARAALRKRRKESAQRYKDAMKNAWSGINETIGDLAMDHHRPLRRVEVDFYRGGQLVRRHHQKTNAWNAFLWHLSQGSGNVDGGKFKPFFNSLS